MTKLDNRTAADLQTRRAAAENRLLVIRNALSVADEELERALVERDWEVFDLPSFEAYCAEKIPEFKHFTMRPESRLQRIERLRRLGATIPQIVAATGSSLGTVHRSLEALEGGHKRPAVSKWKDEEQPEPLSPEVIADATNWQVVRRHVSKAGARGLTCHEFEQATGWGHGRASAAFHSAEHKGYIHRDGTLRRLVEKGPGHGVYVVAR